MGYPQLFNSDYVFLYDFNEEEKREVFKEASAIVWGIFWFIQILIENVPIIKIRKYD